MLLFLFKYLFIYLAGLSLSCGIWDLVSWPGMEPRPPTFRAWSLSLKTAREVPHFSINLKLLRKRCYHFKQISRCSYVCRKVKSLSRVQLFATPWTVALQASPSMGFSKQGYWSGLPFPSLGDLPDPEIKTMSLALQADSLLLEPPGKAIMYAEGKDIH